MCTSTFSALNYWGVIFFKSLSCLLHEVGRTNFSADFWTFRKFDLNFATTVAPSSDKNDKYVVHLKGLSVLKKRSKTASKSTH